ncbi:MAG TPA: hypothetical protein VGW57_01380 [Chthoniobacterales bacterium]|nr:hypothetical protein [Chthoniobacterales bacterium]
MITLLKARCFLPQFALASDAGRLFNDVWFATRQVIDLGRCTTSQFRRRRLVHDGGLVDEGGRNINNRGEKISSLKEPEPNVIKHSLIPPSQYLSSY